MKTISEISDHKEAAEILAAEFAALGWNATKVHGGHLAEDDKGWRHYAWTVEIAPPCKPHVFLDWKCGVGHVDKFKRPTPPKASEVLARYCTEYLEAKAQSFEDWADCFGYDQDSRSAFRIYEDCLAHGKKLLSLGLSREQLQRFADLSNLL